MSIRDPKYRKPKYVRPETWKPDLKHRNEVRWPKSLVYATPPESWSALDLRLLIFLVSHLDIDRMWSEHRLHIRDIKAWSGATKSQILASMSRLAEDHINIRMSAADIFQGITGRPDSFRVLANCRLDGQQLFWTFSSDMIRNLADMKDGYGRLHVEAIRRLRTFANLRLYAVACFTKHSYTQQESLTWEPPELVSFLGGKPMKNNNNLRRFVDGVMADLKHVGVYAFSCVSYRRTKARGRPIDVIVFVWDDESRATLWGAEIEANAKRVAEEKLELERNPPPLTELQVYRQQREAEELRERKRAQWELEKERAVEEREVQESLRISDEFYQKVMAS